MTTVIALADVEVDRQNGEEESEGPCKRCLFEIEAFVYRVEEGA